MGIVNIDEELHDRLRRAAKVSCRSINAQAAYWIKIGMLCEMNPGLTVTQILAREMEEAGLTPPLAPQPLDRHPPAAANL